MRKVAFILIAIALSSCLKKIEEVDTANTNIFDPQYAGEQWWTYEDVFTYTNSNNDQFIRFEIGIPEENAPNLKPPKIDLAVTVNDGTTYYPQAEIYSTGGYLCQLDISPTGATNFCLEVGIYVEDEGIIINQFSECKDL